MVGPNDPRHYIRNLSRDPGYGLPRRRRRRRVGLTAESKGILIMIGIVVLAAIIIGLAMGMRIIPTRYYLF